MVRALFLTLKLTHVEPLAIHELQYGFPTMGLCLVPTDVSI
jgi:hypothetical protein